MEISVCIFNLNAAEAEMLQRFTAAVLFHADYRARVLSCTTESALKKIMTKYPYLDLLFLPATTFGVGLGKEIRRSNRTTTIVYLSGDDESIYEAFHSLPIAYLTQGKDKKSLSETILRAAAWVISGKQTFCYESRTQILQLKYKDIDYFESEYRVVHIHRTDGTRETITAKLDEIEAMLGSNYFCRCHKSYLVNLENIDRVSRSEKTVLFKSGAMVFSSKAHYPSLIAALKGDVACEAL